MYQSLTIVGNLGADPTLRTLENGNDVTSFSVADSRKFKTAAGEDREEVTWVRVAVFGKQAAPCAKYLTKGSAVLVEGILSPDENGNPKIWTDKEGKTRASYEVRARTVRFLSSKKSEEEVEF
jgi:single-strand DNA-binding protein